MTPERGSSSAVFMEETLSLQQCAERLERRGFRSFVVPGLKEAAGVMRGLVRELNPASASYGDSMTLKATGILDDLRSNPDIQFYDGFLPDMDREEKWEIRRRGMTADLVPDRNQRRQHEGNPALGGHGGQPRGSRSLRPPARHSAGRGPTSWWARRKRRGNASAASPR